MMIVEITDLWLVSCLLGPWRLCVNAFFGDRQFGHRNDHIISRNHMIRFLEDLCCGALFICADVFLSRTVASVANRDARSLENQ